VSYDTDAVARSISDFVECSPGFEIAVPGHGVPFHKNDSAKLAELAATL